jgi:hypothetical protein
MCGMCRKCTRDTVGAVVEKEVQNRLVTSGKRVHEEREVG